MALPKFPPSYLIHSADELLTDAAFRAAHPGMARALRVAELGDLAHLDPDLGSLTGTNAELAEWEMARVERQLFGAGVRAELAIVVHDGVFPPTDPRPEPNIIARATAGPPQLRRVARVRALRRFGSAALAAPLAAAVGVVVGPAADGPSAP